MMLLVSLALAAPPAPAPELTPRQQEEIVVLGRKLETWRGTAHARKGRHECKTSRSSGDPAVDRIACSAMVRCMSRAQPTVDRLLANRLSRKDRERLLQPVQAELKLCMQAAHQEGLRQLARQEEALQSQ